MRNAILTLLPSTLRPASSIAADIVLAEPVEEERIRHLDQQQIVLQLDAAGRGKPGLERFGRHLTFQMLENLVARASAGP